MINTYTKARIYTADKVFVGDAEVVGKYGDKEILLLLAEKLFGGMRTSLIITLYNDSYGLITYKGELVEFKETDSEEHGLMYEAKCELFETLEIVQRRGNVKMKVSIPVTISLIEDNGNPKLQKDNKPEQHAITIKDISASGLFFVGHEPIPIGQRFDFLFTRCSSPFIIAAEILRAQEFEDGTLGFGCKYVGMSNAKEAIIRQYVFKLQLLEQ